ncbi:dihydropteroate synthase [Treponema sp. C6A8]|uniref:dihydropteroate synthase n=1 Tax=Treponema sp. C6A8 TaxID=1410609 RepID=UPI0004813DFC|nr:dihydropteroate synthase [Treponema sp. C6A8]
MIELNLATKKITTDLPAFVMGIVNATPDSFFSGSRGGIERALQLIEEGADLLDLGAESTRPGSEYVSEEEEIRRLIPLIKEIRKNSDIPLSIDTRKAAVFKAAVEAGADILNDISALEDAPELADFCAKKGLPVILMHKRGNPGTMQKNTAYTDCFSEVNDYLIERAAFAEKSGIAAEKIILDPGIGFGKNTRDNFQLIRRCGELAGGKYNVLMALSRKTCIGEATGRAVEDRLYGTLAADLVAVQKGAFMVRVHDVKETVDTLKVLKACNNIE